MLRLVVVNWIDTMGSTEWYHLVGYKTVKPGVCRTVGWVINEFPEYIEVAQSLMDDGDPGGLRVNHTMSIPKVCVTSINDVITEPNSVDT